MGINIMDNEYIGYNGDIMNMNDIFIQLNKELKFFNNILCIWII